MQDQSTCCSKTCGYVIAGSVGNCPKCGSKMQMTSRARRTGKVMVALAVIIILTTGGLAIFLAPGVLQSSNPVWGPVFDGTPRQGVYMLMTFGVVIVFGLNALAAGIWQIRRGRKNVLFFYVAMALAFGLFSMAGAATKAFDDADASGRAANSDPKRHVANGAGGLVKVARDLNNGLPRMVDNQTRIERVTAGPGPTLNFTFTLVKLSLADFKPEDPAFLAGVVADLKRQQCALAITKDMFERGATVHETWNGSDGRTVAELQLTPEKCK